MQSLMTLGTVCSQQFCKYFLRKPHHFYYTQVVLIWRNKNVEYIFGNFKKKIPMRTYMIFAECEYFTWISLNLSLSRNILVVGAAFIVLTYLLPKKIKTDFSFGLHTEQQWVVHYDSMHYNYYIILYGLFDDQKLDFRVQITFLRIIWLRLTMNLPI